MDAEIHNNTDWYFMSGWTQLLLGCWTYRPPRPGAQQPQAGPHRTPGGGLQGEGGGGGPRLGAEGVRLHRVLRRQQLGRARRRPLRSLRASAAGEEIEMISNKYFLCRCKYFSLLQYQHSSSGHPGFGAGPASMEPPYKRKYEDW